MKVGIIGGGITGLTTALALHKVGIPSIVFERAAQINEVGAGIWLHPNALQVMAWLGIDQPIINQGVTLSRVELTDAKLKPLKMARPNALRGSEGHQTLAIHRARLQSILLEEVQKRTEVRLGHTYLSHAVQSDGIQVAFKNTKEKLSILLGADGIDSKVRQSFLPEASLRDSRQICWRGIAHLDIPDSLQELGQEAWGHRIRFGFSPIHEKEVYWFAVVPAKNLAKAQPTRPKSYLRRIFNGFSPVVTNLLENTPKSTIHQANLYDLKRLPTWHDAQCCLLGDAAHATTPNMGQGACQGIEDAYSIARSLAQFPDKPQQAFMQFQSKRRKKVDYVVNTSWRIGQMAHHPIGQAIMVQMIKHLPERMILAQMKKLYQLDSFSISIPKNME